ncbi:MAG TPA: hypothetical protein VMR31_06910 [Myxococcota bacterium]|nr:hypothetical protein [Myxococcota bacterium]
MSPEANQALRLGMWLVGALVAAALLFLVIGGRARAAEPDASDEAAKLLLAPETGAASDRAQEARDLLATDRNRKIAVISSALVDLGLRASFGASPVKLLQSAGELGQGILAWSNRTPGEERALLLLAPDAIGGELDAPTRELYEHLAVRERKVLVKHLLGDAEKALDAGELRRARIAVDRALELDPGSEPGDRLLDALEARELRASPASREPTMSPGVAPWETSFASALLVDDDSRAQQLAPANTPSAELASAAALYESGQRAEALEAFRSLAQGDGPASGVAREILDDRAVNPERALDDEIKTYTHKRSLGWLGGDALADRGLDLLSDDVDLSGDSLRAWKASYKLIRKTANPVNLVIDAPARIWRDWQPDGSALREAATRYLELEPNGPRAADAQKWLAKLGKDERRSVKVSPFKDGYFMLPHARTRFARVAPQRLVVSSDALEKKAPELAHALGLEGSEAFVFGDRGLPEGAQAVAPGQALELLALLGDGLDEDVLQPRIQSGADVLEALRRLDARVRAGATLRVMPRAPDSLAGLDDFGSALVDQKRARTWGDVALGRKDDKITADRQLGGDGRFCLADTPCIDRKLPVDGALFAQTDAEGAAGVGARAGYRQAQLQVTMGAKGPHASLVLPIARWLGITHYLPVEARVDVGLDGVSAGPRVDTSAADEAAERL